MRIATIRPAEPASPTKEAAVSQSHPSESGARAPEDLLRSMHAASVGMLVHRDGVIVETNAAFAEMFGLERAADAAGRSVLDFVAPEARARVAALITNPPTAVVEYDCLRADGLPLIARGEAHAVEYDGRPSRLTVLTPVDREGMTADRLHQASEFFRLAFEHAPTGKAMVSPEGRILAVNPALAALVGIPERRLLGRPYNVLAHPDDAPVGAEPARALLAGESSGFRMEQRYVHAEGHVIRVQISVSLVRTLDGQPRYFVAQVEDVTQQRDAEAALQRETERLRLLQAVAEAANTAEEPDGAYATALEAVCRHTGWPLGHVYHQPRGSTLLVPSDLSYLDPRDEARFRVLRRHTAGTTLPTGIGLPGLAAASGSPVWIRCDDIVPICRDAAHAAGIRSAVALPVPAGNETVAVLEFFTEDEVAPDAALVDLLRHVGTQLGRVAERAQSRAQAAALDDARARFVANAAHELRTPLATLRTVAGLLGSRREQMTEAEIAQCCDILERQGANLGTLVEDLLDLSRIQSRHEPDAAERVDVQSWVTRALETALAPDGTTVSLHVEPGLSVRGHPDRLNRALVNLLANAYRHGGPTVAVRAARDGADVVVLVEDDGDGVPEDLVADLFEPFACSGTGSGAGLGLAITRALVEEAGGSVAYQGATDQGARFVLRLQDFG